MTETRAIAPIIIKKKKIVASGGHHGGAWKVAYADFVTAMMAFFMLMWLLNATTESQRKGIADYFSPTIPINRISGGGDGMFGGDSVFAEDVLPQNGTGGENSTPAAERQAKGTTGVDTTDLSLPDTSEVQQMLDLEKKLMANSGESNVADELLQHILTRVTDEGLIVEIFDLPGEPLFEQAGTEPSEMLRQLTAMIAGIFAITANQVSVNGFTQSYPIVLRQDPGWDRSTAQAHQVRKLLETGGLMKSRVEKVVGWADRQPADANPMAVRNNRLEIILLRNDKAAVGK